MEKTGGGQPPAETGGGGDRWQLPQERGNVRYLCRLSLRHVCPVAIVTVRVAALLCTPNF